MLIETILQKLSRYPGVTYSVKGSYLEIPAQSPNGFRVWIQDNAERYTVGFEGWHEEFSDQEQALNCFAFGLSSACRLRVFSRGRMDYKWQVFHEVDGRWVTDGETGLLLSPFWRRVSTRDLQNNVTPA